MDTCTFGAQRRGDIGPYDYVRCGKTSDKVGCSMDRPGSEREQPSMNVVKVTFGGPRGSGWAQDQFFSGSLVFL